MTTETSRDPVVDAWSDRLEEELVEAGMDPPQARAYRLAFELGLTRVVSQTATRQELQDGLAENRRELRQELQDGLAENRRELRQGLSDLRREMAEMQDGLRREIDGLRREMDARFESLEKRLNLFAWALGLGFTGIFGLLAAILAAILARL